MPARKRRVAEENDSPDTKRRVTRSAAKQSSHTKEADELKTSRRATNAEPKTRKRPRAAETASPKEEHDEHEKEVETPPRTKKTKETKRTTPKSATQIQTQPPAPSMVTVHHASLKKPITCHLYGRGEQATPAPRPLIFTHGAGGTLAAPAVANFCTGYARLSPVFAFQGSMNLAARVKGFHACIAHWRLQGHHVQNQSLDLALGGRSMGARAAAIAGAEILSESRHEDGRGGNGTQHPSLSLSLVLVLVSYPLRNPKGDVRDQILLHLPRDVRVLFVVGDRDAMCPLQLLEETRGKMAARSRVVVVRGADHGMCLRAGDGDEREIGERAGEVAAGWVGSGGDDGEDGYIGGEEGG